MTLLVPGGASVSVLANATPVQRKLGDNAETPSTFINQPRVGYAEASAVPLDAR